MPIYEYECEACGFRHEVLQKVNDPLLTECPECEKSVLKKLVSAAGFRLSGSGWYETDFKSDGKRNIATGDSQKKSESKTSSKDAKQDSQKENKKDSGKKDSSTSKGSASSAKKDAKAS